LSIELFIRSSRPPPERTPPPRCCLRAWISALRQSLWFLSSLISLSFSRSNLPYCSCSSSISTLARVSRSLSRWTSFCLSKFRSTIDFSRSWMTFKLVFSLFIRVEAQSLLMFLTSWSAYALDAFRALVSRASDSAYRVRSFSSLACFRLSFFREALLSSKASLA